MSRPRTLALSRPADPAPTQRSRFTLLTFALGAVAACLSLALTWRRSIGNDEGATLTSALRPWGALWDEVLHLDAVHAAYYALMHLWFDVVPANPFTLRLPSAIFVGIAVVLLAYIGRELMSERVGLFAAAVLAVMPRVTYVGGDARSLALALALSLACFLFVLRAGKSQRAWMWLVYGVLVAAATTVNFYTALVIPAQLLLVKGLQARWRGLLAAGLGVLVATPLILLAASQSGQLGWLRVSGLHTVEEVLVEQFADTSVIAAVLLWVGAAVGAVIVWHRYRALTWALAWWLLMPTLMLVVVSFLHPLYHPRYVTASAPAVALLLGVALASIPRRWQAWVALVLLGAVCAPAWYERRGLKGLDGTRWDLIAARVEAVREPGAVEVVALGPMAKKTYRGHRRVAYSYPASFEGMTDLTLGTAQSQNEYLWGADDAPTAHLERLEGANRVVVLVAESERQRWAQPLEQALLQRGFTPQLSSLERGTELLVYTR